MSEASASEVLLRAEGVHVRRGGSDVLHGVDLAVARGEVVALLGPNGAGKSTLLDTLGGVLVPSAGRVERNARVAVAMQSPGLARRSVIANVELALAWWGVPRRERRDRALEALTRMRADHLVDRSAVALSGGERRRVHLARAVAIRPEVLLLDEPFTGLDRLTHDALCDDASSALRTSGAAVVLVVHDRAEAWAMADRLVVMYDGRVVAEGRPSEVLASPPDARVARFLGYDGEVLDGDEVLLTRPAHVRLDPAGELAATVTRVVSVEDGSLLEVDTGHGRLRVRDDTRATALGARVSVSVHGGVRFPAGQASRPVPRL